MDLRAVGEKVTEGFKKYRYVILVLVLGIGLMLIPTGKQERTGVTQSQVEKMDISSELEHILCRIKGAGDVQVLLTQSAGEKTVYQTDEDASESGRRSETVLITDSDRKEQGLVQQVLPPRYQGAVIVCDGADDPAVRLAIVEAVSDATGLGADRISVLKMK